MKSLPALLLALGAASAFAQSAYRWVGNDGKVHYSDEPPPPAEVKKVEQKRFDASVIASGGKLSYETRQAAANFPLTLYTTPECDPGCRDARNFLQQRGVPFAEKVVKTADDAAAFKKAAGGDALLVPTLMVGNKAIKGYEAGAWAGALETAGYGSGK